MQVVCSTRAFKDYPLEEALEQLAVVGCEAVELVVTEAATGHELLDWRSLGTLQHALDESHLRASLVDGALEPHDSADHWLKRAKASVDLAAAVEAPAAVVHPLDSPDFLSVLVPLLAHADKRSVRIALEAAPGSPLADPKALGSFLDQHAHPRLLAGLDASTVAEQGLELRDAIALLGHRLWSLRIPAEAVPSPDVAGALCLLAEQHYAGIVTVTGTCEGEAPYLQAQEALRGLRATLLH